MIREPPQGSLSLEELRKKIIELLFKHLVSPSEANGEKPALMRLGHSQHFWIWHRGQLPGLQGLLMGTPPTQGHAFLISAHYWCLVVACAI